MLFKKINLIFIVLLLYQTPLNSKSDSFDDFNPKILSKKYIQEIYDTLNDNDKCLNIIKLARSAQRNNMSKLLHKITSPTLLVWGLNDTITPPSVAHEFNRLIKNSKIKFIDNCCHAPMMEHPKLFNKYIVDFLK